MSHEWENVAVCALECKEREATEDWGGPGRLDRGDELKYALKTWLMESTSRASDSMRKGRLRQGRKARGGLGDDCPHCQEPKTYLGDCGKFLAKAWWSTLIVHENSNSNHLSLTEFCSVSGPSLNILHSLMLLTHRSRL